MAEIAVRDFFLTQKVQLDFFAHWAYNINTSNS